MKRREFFKLATGLTATLFLAKADIFTAPKVNTLHYTLDMPSSYFDPATKMIGGTYTITSNGTTGNPIPFGRKLTDKEIREFCGGDAT